MPRSKRDKVVALTQTNKKDKAHKGELMDKVKEAAEQFEFAWVFGIEHNRNNTLKEVRQAWKGSKIFMSRNAVMRKALGATVEEECRLGVSKIANLLEGDVGLLFTDEQPTVVTEWFETFKKDDYARSGNQVEQDFVLPEGPIMLGEVTAPHSLEPQFRRLGLSTYLVRGVPTLKAPHTVCKAGDTLNANQVQILKLFMKPLATFQIVPKLGVQLTNGQVCGGSLAESQ